MKLNFGILLVLQAVCLTHIGSAQSENISRHASVNFSYGRVLTSGEFLGDIFSLSYTIPKGDNKILEFEGRYLDYILDQPVRNAQDSIVSGSEEEIESFAIRTKYGVRLLSEKWIEPQFLPYMSALRNERAYVPYKVNRIPYDAREIGLGLGIEFRTHFRIEEAVSVFVAVSNTFLRMYHNRVYAYNPFLLERDRTSTSIEINMFDQPLHLTGGLRIGLWLK